MKIILKEPIRDYKLVCETLGNNELIAQDTVMEYLDCTAPFIEAVNLDENYTILYNSNAAIDGKLYNTTIDSNIFAGNILFVRQTDNEYCFTGLSDEDVAILVEKYENDLYLL